MGARRLTALVAVQFALLGISASGASASVDCPGDDQVPTASTFADSAASVVCDINVLRVQHGLQPLTVDTKLQKSAQALADDEARHDYVAHVDSAGRTLDDRVDLAGYASVDDAVLLLENIDWGAGTRVTPIATVYGWFNSTAHRTNMFNPDIRNVGIGMSEGTPASMDESGVYYVADFGVRQRATTSTTRTTSTSTSTSTRSTSTKSCAQVKKARHTRKHTRKSTRKRTRRVSSCVRRTR